MYINKRLLYSQVLRNLIIHIQYTYDRKSPWSLQPSNSKHELQQINGYAVTELVHVIVVNIEQFTTVALQIEDRVQK